jgi:hypothetical protein
LEGQLDSEREVACDEITVALTGSAKAYAACLATVAALLSGPVPTLPALAAVSSSGLSRRIVRIFGAYPVGCAQSGRALAIGAGVAISAFTLVIGSVPVVRSVDSALGVPSVVRPAAMPPTATYELATPAATVGVSLSSMAPQRRAMSAGESARVARRHPGAVVSADSPTVEPPVVVEAAATLPSIEPALHVLASRSVEMPPLEVPAASRIEVPYAAIGTDTGSGADTEARAPWGAVVDAGVAIGRGSRNAGVETAGFFTRFSKQVAGSF